MNFYVCTYVSLMQNVFGKQFVAKKVVLIQEVRRWL